MTDEDSDAPAADTGDPAADTDAPAEDATRATDGAGSPLDVATLGVLGRRAEGHPLVESWSFEPDELSPRHLELRLDADQFPPLVDAVRLDVRWYEGDDYAVHYVESRADGRWQCRWDRHRKPDAPSRHFHPPPDASDEVEKSPLDAEHHLGVLFEVLAWVQTRVGAVHGE